MTSDSETVSVIVPCYNHGKYILHTVASVLLSDYPCVEVIVVDDGSTDALTLDAMVSLESEGVCVVRTDNKGVGAARNTGLRAASGKYVLMLDADNIIYSNMIATLVSALQANQHASVAYSDFRLRGASSGEMRPGEFSMPRLLLSNYIDNCTVMRTNCLRQVGGYDERRFMSSHADWALWMRMLMSKKAFVYVPEVLWEYTVDSQSMLQANGRDLKNVARIHAELLSQQLAILDSALEGEIGQGASGAERRTASAEIMRLNAYYQLNYGRFGHGVSLAIRSVVRDRNVAFEVVKNAAAAGFRRLMPWASRHESGRAPAAGQGDLS